eukprot:963735_1
MFLELSLAKAKIGAHAEASKILQDAKNVFKGTSQADRISLVDSDICVYRGNVDDALRVLRSIKHGSSFFLDAKTKMADIYLKHKRNKSLYVRCFQDMVAVNPSSNFYILLGNAYLRTQDPRNAVKSFEAALEDDPDNVDLYIRIGRALLTTHDYEKAIEVFENALESHKAVVLSLQLGELYLQFGKYDLALRVLNESLDGISKQSDSKSLEAMRSMIKANQVISRVYERKKDLESFRKVMSVILDLYRTILRKAKHQVSETEFRQLKLEAADIAFCYGNHYQTAFDDVRSRTFFSEALRFYDGHEKSLLALAQIHFNSAEFDACKQQCNKLLKSESSREEALIMLADVMARKNEFDNAILHLQRLLEHNPCHYKVLVKMIKLSRRAGNVKEVTKYVQLAQRSSIKADYDSGLHYCKGLIDWYFNNDPRSALKEFNQARKDGEWGNMALEHMVDIYLNPDNDLLFGDKADESRNRKEHINSAEKLLEEIKIRSSKHDPKLEILTCYILMASGEKASIESATQKLMLLLQLDKDNVRALLALASAFRQLKQIPKARNQLKRIMKMKVTSELEDDFQKAWLMLADIYISSGKYDLAQDLCKKVLQINKSCSKAWEHLGVIMEKERAYKDAASHYEQSWRYSNEASSRIGYKLAFNYLKAERYVDAIDVCNKVLEQNPDYPTIRRHVLQKAREQLRV